MSYHVPKPRLVRRANTTQLAPYPLYPLSEAQALPPEIPLTPIAEPNRNARRFFIGFVVVVALLALLAWLDSRSDGDEDGPVPGRSPIRKQSTAQMAKNLYERLEARGGASDTTMRSLAQLAKNA